jgi:hypothetical protein
MRAAISLPFIVALSALASCSQEISKPSTGAPPSTAEEAAESIAEKFRTLPMLAPSLAPRAFALNFKPAKIGMSMSSPPGLYLHSSRLLNRRTFWNALLKSVARLKWGTRESLICFAAAIRFLSLIGLSRRIMDQIDLALLTLHFLALVQLLRESTELFRFAPRVPRDPS